MRHISYVGAWIPPSSLNNNDNNNHQSTQIQRQQQRHRLDGCIVQGSHCEPTARFTHEQKALNQHLNKSRHFFTSASVVLYSLRLRAIAGLSLRTSQISLISPSLFNHVSHAPFTDFSSLRTLSVTFFFATPQFARTAARTRAFC